MKKDYRKVNGGSAKMIDSNLKKHRNMIKIMAGIIIVLVLFIAFFFVVAPQVNKFAANKQIEGANYVYLDILNRIQAQGYYVIPVSENETLVLVPYMPEQQQLSDQIN